MDHDDMLRVLTELDNKRKEVMGHAADLVTGRVVQFFNEHPEVEQIRWTQYIPGFNDGDPCLFSLGDVELKFVGEEEFSDFDWTETDTIKDKALEDAERILYFVMNYEVLEAAFGTDVELTFSRDGSLSKEDYFR